MAKVQPAGDLRGLVIPEPATLEATYTATSQSGARPGPVIPSQATGLLLHSSGTIDTASETSTGKQLTIRTDKSGGVGTARILWKYDGDSYRQWDPPFMLSGWEFIARSTTAQRYRAPHVIRRRATGLLAVSATYDTNSARVYAQDKYGKWTEYTVENTGNATRTTLVDLPSGRLLCLYTYQVSASRTQIRMAYSDDDGATWTTGSTACLPSGFTGASSTIKRLRAVELNGQICLLFWSQVSADELYQYVSTDGGATFSQVEVVATANYAYPDLYVYQSVIYAAVLQYDASYTPVTVRPYLRKLGTAAQPFSSALGTHAGATTGDERFGTFAAGAFTNGDLALTVNDDGFVLLYGCDFSATGTRETITRVSADGGATWFENWQNSHGGPLGTTILYTGSAATAGRELTATTERGRVVLVHGVQTNPGGVASDFTSLCAAYCGGWSTVGMPEPGTGESWETAGWDTTYVPIDTPTDTSATIWTRTTAGAPTQSLTDNGLRSQTAALETQYWSAVPVTTGYEDDGVIAEWQLTMTSGTVRHQLQISDGTANDYRVRVIATTTTLELYDVNAAASIATLTIDTTKGVVIRVHLQKGAGGWAGNNGSVRAWARIDGPYTGGVINYGPRQDREWSLIGSSGTLTRGPLTANEILFGTVTTAADARWRWCVFSGGAETGGNDTSTGGTSRGHIVPAAGSAVHLVDGLRVHGVDGPTVAGDLYTTAVQHDYPVSAINPSTSPSPRRKWRSTADTQQDIKLAGLDLGCRAGDVWAVYVAGCNWASATLYRDFTGANKLLDLNLAHDLVNLGFSRSRDLVSPALSIGGGAVPFYLPEGALKDCYLDFGSNRVRKIAANTSGQWQSKAAGNYASVRVRLDSYDAGDPGSGTCTLRMSRGVFLIDNMVSTDELMLRIPAQDTAENYFTLGTLVIGRVRWFGRQYSRGRSLGFVPAYELSETRSGARQVRALGPTRRTVEIAWDDGIDTSQMHNLPTEPDYWTFGYSGADALTAPTDTASTLAGIIGTTQGATLPVVLLPAVKQQASAPGTNGVRLIDPERSLYGRILTDTLRIDSDPAVMGDELRSPGEMVKVGSVRIEEEV